MPELPDAVILCGGAGLRLSSITGKGQKAMAPIAGRPFLELLLRQLSRNGFKRVILAVGYRQDSIRSHFGQMSFGLQLLYSSESSPMGTGGALRNATRLISTDPVLVMNGDSYTNADLRTFAQVHQNTEADMSLVVAPADGRGDCGNVKIDAHGTVLQFQEKQVCLDAHYLNAGIYLIARHLLHSIPLELKVSLEQELLGKWLASGTRITAVVYPGSCLDIGTPERYLAALEVLASTEVDALPGSGGNFSCE